MPRISKSNLNDRVKLLNECLNLPKTMFIADYPPGSNRMNVGHIYVDHNYAGYQLEQIVSEHGAAHNLTNRLTAKEMNCYIGGVLAGISMCRKN